MTVIAVATARYDVPTYKPSHPEASVQNEFAYAVADSYTGNYKSPSESRDVKGYYILDEADDKKEGAPSYSAPMYSALAYSAQDYRQANAPTKAHKPADALGPAYKPADAPAPAYKPAYDRSD